MFAGQPLPARRSIAVMKRRHPLEGACHVNVAFPVSDPRVSGLGRRPMDIESDEEEGPDNQVPVIAHDGPEL